MCLSNSQMWSSASVSNAAKFSIPPNLFECGTHCPPVTKDWTGRHKESQQLVKETKALLRPEVCMSMRMCACIACVRVRECMLVHACFCFPIHVGGPNFGNSPMLQGLAKISVPTALALNYIHFLNLRLKPELKLNRSPWETQRLLVQMTGIQIKVNRMAPQR